jgi:hypothetical protein
MKRPYLIDLVFIIVLALVLTVINEVGLEVKNVFLFIPLLACYYIGRYVSSFIKK